MGELITEFDALCKYFNLTLEGKEYFRKWIRLYFQSLIERERDEAVEKNKVLERALLIASRETAFVPEYPSPGVEYPEAQFIDIEYQDYIKQAHKELEAEHIIHAVDEAHENAANSTQKWR